MLRIIAGLSLIALTFSFAMSYDPGIDLVTTRTSDYKPLGRVVVDSGGHQRFERGHYSAAKRDGGRLYYDWIPE